MNNKYKSIFLTGVSTILLLSGCCEDNSNNNENDNDNVNVVDSKTDVVYSNLIMTFEPGEHIINYFDYLEISSKKMFPYGYKDGFIETNIPSFDGYELVSTDAIEEKIGYGSRTIGMVYVFVNNKPVQATGIYNYDKNIYEFYEPGMVVQEKVLK